MPVDELGAVVGASAELVGEAMLGGEPHKRGRWRRVLYWAIVALLVGGLVTAARLASG